MCDNTAIPFDEQVVFPEKEQIPELDVGEVNRYHQVFRFNGSIRKPHANLVIGTKVLPYTVLMKPNCVTAISQSNKRYLESFELLTDYIEPNQLLYQSLGFSADESKYLVYARNLEVFPVDFVVTGYDVEETKEALGEPKVEFSMKNGMKISSEETVKILSDWMLDNDYRTSFFDELAESCEDADVASSRINLSAESKAYGEEMSPDDAWDALECACMHSYVETFVKSVAIVSGIVYSTLREKYEEGGIILVNTRLQFGFDEDAEMRLTGDVGTPDTSLVVCKEHFEETGAFESLDQAPVLKYFESVGYDVNSDEKVPELPEDVLDEVTDMYWYLAEAICDDLAFELNM